MRKAEDERVTKVSAAGNEAVDRDEGARREWGTQRRMEISKSGDCIDVFTK